MSLGCQNPTKMTYLALGDSYTIGEGVPQKDSWPFQLTERLRQRGIEIGDPTVVAKTGWTTDELSKALDEAKLEPPYDVVSLLIGVNNQYRGRSAEEFRKEFRELLDRAIGYAGGKKERVFVLSIPDYWLSPFIPPSQRVGISNKLGAFNTAIQSICAEEKVALVHVPGVSEPSGNADYTDDLLHPSASQYTRWVEAALPVVSKLLAGAKPGG